MTVHPRFDEIRAAAIAAFGTPDADREGAAHSRCVAWDRWGVTLVGTRRTVYFAHSRTYGAWWIVDDVTTGATVTLDDAIDALRPIVRVG